MKFRFKIQQYQTDAVERTVGAFAGQPAKAEMAYRRDTGKQTSLDDIGYRNSDIELNNADLLANIQKAQTLGDIPLSNSLMVDSGLGRCSLDIEMETGTGKTYVYIKTMFELNRRYGWSKFIVVVPSVAIREGVMKSFSQLEDHFMEHYGKKARYFVYNSSNLYQIDQYSSSADLNCMIINMQAFNTSMKEGAANKESRIIYSERDDFGSRRPIDVLAANRPIIIMDEPQKMEGEATRKALKNFKPLFVLNYSATHKTQHNQVYALDALDAYRQRLVKKIEVKGQLGDPGFKSIVKGHGALGDTLVVTPHHHGIRGIGTDESHLGVISERQYAVILQQDKTLAGDVKRLCLMLLRAKD